MTTINGLYAMESSKLIAAMRWMHEKVQAGKWFYQTPQGAMTTTLLGERTKLALGDAAHLVFHGYDETGSPVLTGTNMETLRDTDMVPTYVVMVIRNDVSSYDTERFLWKLWGNDAFKRNTMVVIHDGTIARMLLNRMVSFGYKPETGAA